ncbi:non-specific lipid-transfer protein-like protein [Tanacetum coccineum]
MSDCFDYLGKGLRTPAHPSSSYCLGVKDVWKIDLKYVCDGLLTHALFGVKMNMTRADRTTSTCGIQSPLEARPPVAASPLGARPLVQPIERSLASTLMALSGKSGSRGVFEKTTKTSRREDDDINMETKK